MARRELRFLVKQGDRERKERGWMKAGRGKWEEDFQLLWKKRGPRERREGRG